MYKKSSKNMKFSKLITWVTIYSIGMAFIESSVVVYLRELYYPEGFTFPLNPIEGNVAITEILREAATMVMLISIGFLAGRNGLERFAWFIYSFAIWDIFYYVFLKMLVGWPESLLTWDILFLIPVTWVGPVIAPVLLSLVMILFARVILYFTYRVTDVKVGKVNWLLLIFGSLIVIISFTIDYSRFILSRFTLKEILSMPSKQPLFDISLKYIPEKYDWWIFWVGFVLILTAIYLFARRCSKKIASAQ
jgi:hypothetical protein